MEENISPGEPGNDLKSFRVIEEKLLNKLEREQRLERLKKKELPKIHSEKAVTLPEHSGVNSEKLIFEYSEMKKFIGENPELAFIQNRVSGMGEIPDPLAMISLYRIIARTLKDTAQKNIENPGVDSIQIQKLEKTINEHEQTIEEKNRAIFLANETAAHKEKKLNEALEKYEKLDFDFTKYRERILQETNTKSNKAAEEIITKLLPVADNLERANIAATTCNESEALLDGIKKVGDQLFDIFKQLGVEVIDENNTPFDPNIHESLLVEVNEDLEEDTVIEILLKGYTLNSKLLRPASVKVSKKS